MDSSCSAGNLKPILFPFDHPLFSILNSSDLFRSLFHSFVPSAADASQTLSLTHPVRRVEAALRNLGLTEFIILNQMKINSDWEIARCQHNDTTNAECECEQFIAYDPALISVLPAILFPQSELHHSPLVSLIPSFESLQLFSPDCFQLFQSELSRGGSGVKNQQVNVNEFNKTLKRWIDDDKQTQPQSQSHQHQQPIHLPAHHYSSLSYPVLSSFLDQSRARVPLADLNSHFAGGQDLLHLRAELANCIESIGRSIENGNKFNSSNKENQMQNQRNQNPIEKQISN